MASAASSTRRRVSSGILMSVRPFSTKDTVVRDTPASVATSALVGRLRIGDPLLHLDGATSTWSTNARQ